MSEILTSCYTLQYDISKGGGWLGQVVLTSDGMFAAVTDWGNFSYAWRSHGCSSFKEFLMGIHTDYFANKMFSGMNYIASTNRVEAACIKFAEKILPALQKVLKEEVETLRIKQENERAVPWS
jgi:hypothetical protein